MLRSMLDKTDIKTICLHHERDLLTRFSELKNCHAKPRTKSVNPPNKVVPGEMLCYECVIKLTRVQPEIEVEPDVIDEEQYVVSMQDDKKLCISSDVNAALVSLDETPVKTGKLPISSKITKGKQNLQSATKTLKRKLEVSYKVPLGSSSDEEIDLKDLKLYQSAMQELKEKFQNSQSYAERVQILTLSPFPIQ